MFLETTDASIYHEVHGEGRPIVLLHGFGASSGSWAFQRAGLARQRRVVLIDVPGHGRSRWKDGGRAAPTIAGFADAVAQLLDHLKIERAHVAGVSMGGMIALELALARPERVDALVLSDTGAQRLPFAMRLLFALFGWLGGHGLRAPARNMAYPGLGAPTGGDDRHLQSPELDEVRRGVSQHEHRSQVMRAATAVARKGDARPRLATLGAPTLVIVGEDDTIAGLARETWRLIPRAELVCMAASGHGTPVNRPYAWEGVVRDFLDRVERDGTVGGERRVGLELPRERLTHRITVLANANTRTENNAHERTRWEHPPQP